MQAGRMFYGGQISKIYWAFDVGEYVATYLPKVCHRTDCQN